MTSDYVFQLYTISCRWECLFHSRIFCFSLNLKSPFVSWVRTLSKNPFCMTSSIFMNSNTIQMLITPIFVFLYQTTFSHSPNSHFNFLPVLLHLSGTCSREIHDYFDFTVYLDLCQFFLQLCILSQSIRDLLRKYHRLHGL